MKKILILVAALVLSANAATAQEADVAKDVKPMPVRVEARAEIQNARREVKEVRTDLKATLATTTRAEMRQQIETRKEIRASSTEMRRDRVEKTEARIEDRKGKIAEKASSTKARIEVRKHKTEAKIEERLAELAKGAGERASRVVNRLKEIGGKISDRITKNEGAGKDVSMARANLTTAQAKIQIADSAAQALMAVTVNPGDIKGSLEAIRTAATVANKAIRDAQESLSTTVESIK